MSKCCEYCKVPLVSKRRYRSAYQDNELYCPICNHHNTDFCNCLNCQRKRSEQYELRVQKISESYSDEVAPQVYYEMSFLSKVYLGSLFLAFGDENSLTINPRLATSKFKLTPSTSLDSDIYHSLLESRVISVNPKSPVDAFNVDSSQFPSDFCVDKVIYNINVLDTVSNNLIDVMINPSLDLRNASDVALDLWYEIAINECLEYLIYQLKAVKFDFQPGEKTVSVIRDMLSFLSVSQIYFVIYNSIAYWCRNYFAGYYDGVQHATNSIVYLIHKRAENIRRNNWSCFEYKRLCDLPQSALSSYFFNKVLKIGDKGFTCVPSVDVFLEGEEVK